MTKGAAKGTVKDTVKDTAKDTAKDTVKEKTKSTINKLKDTVVDSIKETTKDKSKPAAQVLPVEDIIGPLPASATETEPTPLHTPWKPTPFHEYHHKPSYVIDNGERAPNQVWN